LPYVLTVAQIAAKLQVTEITVYKLIQKGVLPAFKVGRCWRVEDKDFKQYIQRSKTRMKTGQIKDY